MRPYYYLYYMIEKLMVFFQRSKEEVKGQDPEGLCPNCWGNQEYDNTIRDLYKDKQIDVNNHNQHHAFIQDFVMNHVDGITLRKGDSGLVCPTCHVKALR